MWATAPHGRARRMNDDESNRAEPECVRSGRVILECEHEYIRIDIRTHCLTEYSMGTDAHAPYRSIMRLMACWCADSQLGPRGLVVAPKAKKEEY